MSKTKPKKQLTIEEKKSKAVDIIERLVNAGAIFSVRAFVGRAGNGRLSGANVIEIFSRNDADLVRVLFPSEFETGLDAGQRRISVARIEL